MSEKWFKIIFVFGQLCILFLVGCSLYYAIELILQAHWFLGIAFGVTFLSGLIALTGVNMLNRNRIKGK